MVKRFVIGLMVCFVVTPLALGQTPSSSVWPLTADQAPVVTGNLTATNQALSNMQVSYSNSVQRSSPSGTAGSWPGEAAELGTRYMQFAASPMVNFDFTVTSTSLFLYVKALNNYLIGPVRSWKIYVVTILIQATTTLTRRIMRNRLRISSRLARAREY